MDGMALFQLDSSTAPFFLTSGGGASFETTLNGQVIGGEFSLYFMAFVHTLALGKKQQRLEDEKGRS